MQANLPTNYAHDRRAGDAGLDLRLRAEYLRKVREEIRLSQERLL